VFSLDFGVSESRSRDFFSVEEFAELFVAEFELLD